VSRHQCFSRYLIPVPETLSEQPNLLEILQSLNSSGDKKNRLTLRNNPHFYAKLPTSPEAYGDNFKVDPIEDFRHANEFYVLTDRPELVHIMTDSDLQFFGNFWRPKNSIIFKGLDVLLLFIFHVSEVLLDICGRLSGEGIIKASLKGTYCASGSCKQLPVSTVPRASADHHGLRPIITQGYPMFWECLIDCSVGFGFCICTRKTVRYCVTYKTAYANINLNIAIGSLTTNI
jgi:hypothetical protein